MIILLYCATKLQKIFITAINIPARFDEIDPTDDERRAGKDECKNNSQFIIHNS